MSDRLRVKEASGLLIFLNTQLKGWSRKNIKQRLKTGCVLVNDQQIMKHDHELEVGDNVEVRAAGKNTQQGVRRLEILYSDNDLVVITNSMRLLFFASNSHMQKILLLYGLFIASTVIHRVC
ncbi:hypothetical protein ACPSKX_17835 [Moritella viscosa]